MIDFKVLVKVNPEDPNAALTMLGEQVVKDTKAFLATDPNWVRKHAYITAVPVEVAMTVEMRAVLQNQAPGVKFIVTGVTEENAANLVKEYGYRVFSFTVREEPAKDVCKEELVDTCAGKKKPIKLAVKKDEEPEISYMYNGKAVSKDEYYKHVDEFKSLWNQVWDSFSRIF